MSTKTKIVVPIDNDYVKSVFRVFNQFLIEEATGCINAELRLQRDLNHARELYRNERRALCTGSYFGRYTEMNTELLFA